MQEPSTREQYMAADPEMYRGVTADDIHSLQTTDVVQRRRGEVPVEGTATGARFVSREEADAALGPARHILQQVDLIVRTLPDPDRQTAVLMNLIVMSIDRQMQAHPNAPRGKVINALCDEFRKRLQKYIPVKV